MRKGKFWWKKRWLSVCDVHDKHEPDCDMCNHGFWKNIWIHKAEIYSLTLFPRLWKWWIHRKIDRKVKEFNNKQLK